MQRGRVVPPIAFVALATCIVVSAGCGSSRNDSKEPASAVTQRTAAYSGCERGDGRACTSAGMFAKQIGNEQTGIALFERACALGDTQGCSYAAWDYGSLGARDRALALLDRACDLRDADACTRMAREVAADRKRAESYRRRACALGRFGACTQGTGAEDLASLSESCQARPQSCLALGRALERDEPVLSAAAYRRGCFKPQPGPPVCNKYAWGMTCEPLGALLERGAPGLPADPKEAYVAFRCACEIRHACDGKRRLDARRYE